MSDAIETVHALPSKAAASLFCAPATFAACRPLKVGLEIRKLAKRAVREMVSDLYALHFFLFFYSRRLLSRKLQFIPRVESLIIFCSNNNNKRVCRSVDAPPKAARHSGTPRGGR